MIAAGEKARRSAAPEDRRRRLEVVPTENEKTAFAEEIDKLFVVPSADMPAKNANI